jgi:hypothetical protein
LVENKNIPDKTGIKLVGGDFDGIIFLYGNVRFSEDVPPVMKFDFEVLKNPNQIKYKDSREFEFIMGDILVELIDNQLSDNDRRNDNKKSDNE